ncbi:MAG: radical SAM protein [Candidatus Zipacnadales bacterium]
MDSQWLEITHIILARGAEEVGAERVRRRILARFPKATLEYQLTAPPARVELPLTPLERRQEVGKRTLVLGRIRRFLDRNCEPGMGEQVICYPYWHFNAVGNCPYSCKFCYLLGNRGNLKCPAIKIYTNLDDILTAICRIADGTSNKTANASSTATPVLFYGSKLQDFVALDPLTEYSCTLVPFAADHPRVRLLFLTKSANIDGFLRLRHGQHTILSWTLNAEPVIRMYEVGTPSLDERLHAARRAAEAGYQVRFVFMPLIPVPGWRHAYEEAVCKTLAAVRPTRITLGGICMYRSALTAMKGRPDASADWLTPIIDNLQPPAFPHDRFRYHPELRVTLYSHLIACLRARDPDLPVSLCLETPHLWQALALDPAHAPCNCLL